MTSPRNSHSANRCQEEPLLPATTGSPKGSGEDSGVSSELSTERTSTYNTPLEESESHNLIQTANPVAEYDLAEQRGLNLDRDLPPIPQEEPLDNGQTAPTETIPSSNQQNATAVPRESEATSEGAFGQAAASRYVPDIGSANLAPMNTEVTNDATYPSNNAFHHPYQPREDSGTQYVSFQELQRRGMEQTVPPPDPIPLKQSLINAIPPSSGGPARQSLSQAPPSPNAVVVRHILPDNTPSRQPLPAGYTLPFNVPPRKPIRVRQSVPSAAPPQPSLPPQPPLRQAEPTWPCRTKVSTRALPQVPPSRPFWWRFSGKRANDSLSLLEDSLSTIQEQGQQSAIEDREEIDRSRSKRNRKASQAQSAGNAQNTQDMDGSGDANERVPDIYVLDPLRRFFRRLSGSISRCFRRKW